MLRCSHTVSTRVRFASMHSSVSARNMVQLRPGTGSRIFRMASKIHRAPEIHRASRNFQTISANLSATEVPRATDVSDGRWDDADDFQVKQAQKDAERLMKKTKAPEKGSPGNLVSLSRKELEVLAVKYEQPAYRGKQIFDAVYKHGKRSIVDIVQVPKAWREDLESSGVTLGRSEVHHIVTADDGTVKMLLKLADNRVVETVGIPSKRTSDSKQRLTVCVSSQVGCPMRCTFCATGKGGFARNLEPHEIVDQVLTIQEHFGQRVSHVVFMGMGEPMLNIPSVMAAHRSMNEDLGIGARSITISSVGVPNSLQKLARHDLQSTLAISLHAPNQQLREQIIPSAKVYPLEALLEDCHQYFLATKRRISFEYTLLKGVNDSVEQALALAKLLYKFNVAGHVNLIPYNTVDESDFQRPTRAGVEAFKNALMKQKIETSVRETRGMDAAAACGQLRNTFQKTPMAEEVIIETFKKTLVA